MVFLAFEGLSFTGKTTLCNQLIEYYKKKGLKCKYCSHGHLTENSTVNLHYKKAMKIVQNWDFKNKNIITSFLEQGFKSLYMDYSEYIKKPFSPNEFDLVFIDRHFTDQYVTAEHFKNKYVKIQNNLPNYFELILECTYEETIKRASVRRNNHSKLTDYILNSKLVFSDFQEEYKKYSQMNLHNQCIIVDNTNYNALIKIKKKIEEII